MVGAVNEQQWNRMRRSANAPLDHLEVGGIRRPTAAMGRGNVGHALFSHLINESVTIRQRLIQMDEVGHAALNSATVRSGCP